MKKILCIALGICLLTFLSGCVGKNDTLNPMSVSLEENIREEKIILTYGYISVNSMVDIDSGVQDRIVAFNKMQDQYTIEIKKYGDGNWQDGLKALNADISSGKGPDIIELNGTLAREFGRKGIVEDLYQYMDEKSDIQTESFVENVLCNFEENGKLYAIPSSFVIHSLLANPNFVSGETVSFSELLDACKTDGKERQVFNNLNKSYFVSNSILPAIPELIENSVCYFDRPEFKEMLEEIDQFDDSWKTMDDEINQYIKLRENELVFIDDGPIYSFEQYAFLSGLLGDDLFLVGQPTLRGKGATLDSNAPYLAINHASAHKEVAWNFICTNLDAQYLVKQYEHRGVVGFPITRTAFEWCAQNEMEKEKYGQTEDNLVGEKILTSSSGETFSFPMYRFTQEQFNYLKRIITEIIPAEDYSQIEEIVYEELTSYWNGVGDIDRAISGIQNRVQLYLDE